MKKTLMMTGFVSVLALAGAAEAQVLGGRIGGNVGGGVSISRGDLGVRDTVGATRDFARDTIGRGRDAARGASRVEGGGDLEVSTSGGAAIDRNGASADFSGAYGATLNARNGADLGRVVGFGRSTVTGATFLLVESADRSIRAVESTEVAFGADGELDSDLTAYAFNRRPEQDATASGRLSGEGRRDPSNTDADSMN